jgi:hypothetical protein
LDHLPEAPDRALTRRRLMQAGAGTAAALYLGGFERLSGVAGASWAPASLRRSSYAGLAERSFQVWVDGVPQVLELAGADDLPVAATVPSLRGLDDAFALHFTGVAGAAFSGATRELVHPELGRFSLFLAPVEQPGEVQRYEAIIDRTVPIPGLGEDGAPRPVAAPRRQEVAVRNRRRRRRRHRHRRRGR